MTVWSRSVAMPALKTAGKYLALNSQEFIDMTQNGVAVRGIEIKNLMNCNCSMYVPLCDHFEVMEQI